VVGGGEGGGLQLVEHSSMLLDTRPPD